MATTLTISGRRNINTNTQTEYQHDLKRVWITGGVAVRGTRNINMQVSSFYVSDLKRNWLSGGLSFKGTRFINTQTQTAYIHDLKRSWLPGGLRIIGTRNINSSALPSYVVDLFRIKNVTLEQFSGVMYLLRRILQPPGIPWMQTDVTTTAWCWKLTLQDGAVMGFTNHDRDLVINNITYEASSGFEPTAVDTTNDMATDNLDVTGMLDSERIKATDISNGRFDFAEVEIFLCNWAKVTDPVLILRRGTIGRISHGKNGFQAEVRGLLEAFQQAAGLAYQKQCRAQFGDSQCGLNKAAYTFTGTVTSISQDGSFSTNLTQEDDYFSYGVIRFDRTGEEMEVKKYSQTGGGISLFLPVLSFAVGDTFSVSAGCDGNFSTCKTRFSNVFNFRGEPFIPGNDLMASYPGKQDSATVPESQANIPENLKWGGSG